MPKATKERTVGDLELMLRTEAETKLRQEIKYKIGEVREMLRRHDVLYAKVWPDDEDGSENLDHLLDQLELRAYEEALAAYVHQHIKNFMTSVKTMKEQLDDLQDKLDNPY